MRLLTGLQRTGGGAVTLDGRDISTHRPAALAQRIAVVEQQVATDAPVTVLHIVRMGRAPHRGPPSSGERQRAQIARALAQCREELLLDELTDHFDVRHQLKILTLLRRSRLMEHRKTPE